VAIKKEERTKKERRKKPQGKNTWPALFHGAAITMPRNGQLYNVYLTNEELTVKELCVTVS